MVEPLPVLAEEAELRALLLHAQARNILGFAVFYAEEDAGVARLARVHDPAGLGRSILDVYNEVNEGVDDQDIELGTDLVFKTPDEEINLPDSHLVQLMPADISFLLEYLPALILDGQASSIN